MQPDTSTQKDRAMHKYRRYSRQIQRAGRLTALILITAALLLILLPASACGVYVAYTSLGETPICSFASAQGHTVTVTQLGHRGELVESHAFLISVDGQKFLRVTLREGTGLPIYPANAVICTADNDDAFSLAFSSAIGGEGSRACELQCSADFGTIRYLRCGSYTLLAEDVALWDFDPVDYF